MPLRGETRLHAGDDVLLLLDPEQDEREVTELFGRPVPPADRPSSTGPGPDAAS